MRWAEHVTSVRYSAKCIKIYFDAPRTKRQMLEVSG